MLGWRRPNPRYLSTVDTLLVFRMAAPPMMFATRFERIPHDAPINGPVALTWSTADRATGLRPAGAHSDIWYPESAHLLLPLVDLAR